MSHGFAEDAAAVLAAAGIPALVRPGFTPTPLCAFLVERLGAAAGVMVTASHNPPEYNGYKVYWGNGAQIVPPHDVGIAEAIARVGPAQEIPLADLTDARAHGLVRDIGHELDQAYLEGVLAHRLHAGEGTDLTIVYTPMHGVGGPLALEALRRAGFASVHPVPEQLQPDPAFPTVRFPNPEEPGAMDLSRALAERTRADLVLANDPDADRLAVLTREASGELRALTGNEVGVLLGHYLLTQGPRRERPLVMTTIVSLDPAGVHRPPAGRALRRDAHRLQMDRQPRPGARCEGRRGARVRLRGGPRLHGGDPGAGQGRHRRGAGRADLAGWTRARKTTLARVPRGDPARVRRLRLEAAELHAPRRERGGDRSPG